ncbi:MAG TPA: alpha/beta-hydrolase family protein [Ilumatobacteraceae bacterium]|nr:alpha/beta-hydrolase family protein [Ilumatobacteraceae bacterium]
MTAPPSVGAWIGMLVLWWASLRPSMLPRSSLTQAAISAICVAVGYGLGGFVGRVVARWARHRDRLPSPAVRRRIVVALAVVTVVVVGLGSTRWIQWQRDQRELVQLAGLSWTSVPLMLVLTGLVSAVIIGIARLLRRLVARIDRAVATRMQRRAARWTVAAIVTASVLVVVTFVGQRFATWADTNFGTFDGTTADGVEPPTSPTASGSPASFVDWDTLGFEGRNFVAGAPTIAAIESFDPDVTALEPIRVYVGLDSADSVKERVDLAIAELQRTGAFERSVLVAVTPTGTGWVDPDAARTIEYLYGGDTAIVSVQYSFLPSWIAFLLDTTSPKELGTALFDGVHEAWAALPEDDRPVLLAFGQSLGSMGGESAFAGNGLPASIEAITSRYDGALFTGPTRDNAVYGTLVDERDPGSPSWAPTVGAEPNVRVANRIADIDASDASWEFPRLLWVHHPSDAIGTWRLSNLWSPPGWARDPAAYDIPPAATWVPFVTFVQESFDLMAGFSATPGFGHDYRTDFVHSWAAIAPPEGWTAADSDRLRAHLGLEGGP